MPTEQRHLRPIPITEILADLSKPVPKRFIEQRKQGGVMLDYIPWYNVCKLLDYYAPGWHGQIKQMITTSDRLFLTYALTLEAAEGSFTREATRTELLKEVDRKTGGLREISKSFLFSYTVIGYWGTL